MNRTDEQWIIIVQCESVIFKHHNHPEHMILFIKILNNICSDIYIIRKSLSEISQSQSYSIRSSLYMKNGLNIKLYITLVGFYLFISVSESSETSYGFDEAPYVRMRFWTTLIAFLNIFMIWGLQQQVLPNPVWKIEAKIHASMNNLLVASNSCYIQCCIICKILENLYVDITWW